jgi:site-specific DNA-methyltransferase (adenine-specific)
VLGDDNDTWLKPAFAEMYRVLARDAYCFTFYGWPHADRFMQAFRAAGFSPVGHFSLLKRYSSSVGHVRCQHECAYLLAKGNPERPSNPLGDVIEWGAYTGNKHHPTEKPISALLKIIETYSPKDGVVLDPFAGAGSSLIAAKMLGRSYIGVEMDTEYHAVARRRLTEFEGSSRAIAANA